MKEITTSKGVFKINTYNKWNDLIIDANFYKLKFGENIFKLSEITEEQASEIVQDYNGLYNTFTEKFVGNMTNYAYVSLIDLIESHNIEINENTYIFKL